jgi:hypothetical protein
LAFISGEIELMSDDIGASPSMLQHVSRQWLALVRY